MGIRRTELSFEGHYTQIPNAWARDARLSRRARGLLTEITSHRVGWHVTTRSLTNAGGEGRDAVRSMLAELVKYGYLVAEQHRATGGQFGEIEYLLNDPFYRDGKHVTVVSEDPRDDAGSTVVGFPGHGGSTGVGFTGVGFTVDGESATKNTRDKEDHLEEDDFSLLAPDGTSVAPSTEIIRAAFESFYAVYPRKTGRLKALAKFESAVKSGVSIDRLLDAVRRFAADPNMPADRSKIPHPATWLYQGRWDDEPLPARSGGASTIEHGRSVDDILRARQDGHLRAVTS